MTTTVAYNKASMPRTYTHRTRAALDEMHLSAVDEALDADALRTLADGVLQIPPSEDRYFVLTKPQEEDTILPLPHPLCETYCLKWANPTRIGAGAGVAYSLDVIAGTDEPAPARTRHLYITYMDEAGPSRCRVALASAIQQLGPILYTAEADARESRTVDAELRATAAGETAFAKEHYSGETVPMDEEPRSRQATPMDEDLRARETASVSPNHI